MIGAWLAVQLAKNGVAFSELDLSILFQVMELPLDELVVVRVAGSRDERPAPVSHQPESLQRFLAQRREET